MFQCVYISTPLKSCPYKSSATCAWFIARVAEKTHLNICANNKGADQPARPRRLILCANNKGADQPVRPRRLISDFVVRCSSFFFSTKKHLTYLNGEQNDTWNLLVSHRICHFRAILPFDYLWRPLGRFNKQQIDEHCLYTCSSRWEGLLDNIFSYLSTKTWVLIRRFSGGTSIVNTYMFLCPHH